MRSDEGFLLCATNFKPYLTAAQQLADSLKEFAPNHPVVLYTENKWISDPGNHIFDEVHGGMPPSNRAKLLALQHSPFDLTCYLDSDMVCINPKAAEVFNGIRDGYDMAWTKIRTYAAAQTWWDKKNLKVPHGGMCLYRKSERMISFMQQWWENWSWKRQHDWDPRWDGKYPYWETRGWDQFPLHLMLGVIRQDDPWYRPDIKWHWVFGGDPPCTPETDDWNTGEDAKWNWIIGYDPEKEGVGRDEIVFHDYSCLLFKSQYLNGRI